MAPTTSRVATAGTINHSRQGPMKVRDIIKRLEEDGWRLATTRGSHRQYRHLTKPGQVTVAGHPSHDLAPGTLSSILKQAQLERED